MKPTEKALTEFNVNKAAAEKVLKSQKESITRGHVPSPEEQEHLWKAMEKYDDALVARRDALKEYRRPAERFLQITATDPAVLHPLRELQAAVRKHLSGSIPDDPAAVADYCACLERASDFMFYFDNRTALTNPDTFRSAEESLNELLIGLLRGAFKSTEEFESDPASEAADTRSLSSEHQDKEIAITEPIASDSSLVWGASADSFMEAAMADTPPAESDFMMLIRSLIRSQSHAHLVPSAVLTARAAACVPDYENCRALSQKLQLATAIEAPQGLGALMASFHEAEDSELSLMLSAYLIALLINPHQDEAYELSRQAQALPVWQLDLPLEEFRRLMDVLIDLQRKMGRGFTPFVLAQIDGSDRVHNEAEKIREDLAACNTSKHHFKGNAELTEFYREIFGQESDLCYLMNVASSDRPDPDDVALLDDELKSFCSKGSIENSRIARWLQEKWFDGSRRQCVPLRDETLAATVKEVRKRLELCHQWLQLRRRLPKTELQQFRNFRVEILAHIERITTNPVWCGIEDAGLLNWTLTQIKARLTGTEKVSERWREAILTGTFPLSDDGTPLVLDELQMVPFNQPWRSALEHLSYASDPALAEAEVYSQTLGNHESRFKDNLSQRKWIGDLIGKQTVVSEGDFCRAKESAKQNTWRFMADLDKAYDKGWMTLDEQSELQTYAEIFEGYYTELQDFGLWRRFLEGLNRMVQVYRKREEEAATSQLQSLAEKIRPHYPQILRETAGVIEQGNFRLAEEYMGRYLDGETTVPQSSLPTDSDYYLPFLTSYDALFAYQSMRSQRWKDIVKSFSRDRSGNDLKEEKRIRDFLNCWPYSNGATFASQLRQFLMKLGLNVQRIEECEDATKRSRTECEVYDVWLEPELEKTNAHPIAELGSLIDPDAPVRIVHFQGNDSPDTIASAMRSLDAERLSFVVLNAFWPSISRQQLARVGHKCDSLKGGFLLIDRILALYLSLQPPDDRLMAMLQCTLPYTVHQPFSNGSGSIPDEMFVGRDPELQQIKDMSGPCYIYGGRQLGKTILLEKAKHQLSKPQRLEFAAMATVAALGDGEPVSEMTATREIIRCLNQEFRKNPTLQLEIQPCTTFSELSGQLDALLRDEKVRKLVLLIDEADDLFGDLARNGYKSLQGFINLRRDYDRRFKIVMAGLHNICRARSMDSNSPVGQLGSAMGVKPFGINAGVDLLKRPLQYLGMRPDENETVLETLAVNCNFYPGILQYCGYTLANHALCSPLFQELYGQHLPEQAPPFVLREDQWSAAVNRSALDEQLRNKIEMTLRLDPGYMILACCVTMLQYDEPDVNPNPKHGYTVEQIRNVATGLNLACMTSLDLESCSNLLSELQEMSVLVSVDKEKGTYRLRRESFKDLIGRSKDDLEKKMREAAQKEIKKIASSV